MFSSWICFCRLFRYFINASLSKTSFIYYFLYKNASVYQFIACFKHIKSCFLGWFIQHQLNNRMDFIWMNIYITYTCPWHDDWGKFSWIWFCYLKSKTNKHIRNSMELRVAWYSIMVIIYTVSIQLFLISRLWKWHVITSA